MDSINRNALVLQYFFELYRKMQKLKNFCCKNCHNMLKQKGVIAKYGSKGLTNMKIVLCNANAEEITRCKSIIERVAEKHSIPITLVLLTSSNQVLFNIADIESADLIYLDIPLGGMDGVALAQKLRAMSVTADLVFCTNDRSRVFEAFDVDALHYLDFVKSAETEQKFEEVFLKAEKRAKRRASESIVFSCAGERRRVLIDDIIYFEVSRRIITVYYEDKSFEFYSTMAQIEEMLFKKGFHRIHRAFLVAEKYVSEISQSNVVTMDGKVLPVGRQYYAKLRTVIDKEVSI